MIRTTMTDAREHRSHEWVGTKSTASMDPRRAEVDRHLVVVAETADWSGLLAFLQRNRELVNSPLYNQRNWSTLLHQAVRLEAGQATVRDLIDLGALRTIRDSNGRRPVDAATNAQLLHLTALLKPKVKSKVDVRTLFMIQELFHGLTRATIRIFCSGQELWLPQLSILTEPGQAAIWFPIPGMYGGFRCWLDETGESPALIAESFCRIVDGSGRRHRITSNEVILVETGF